MNTRGICSSPELAHILSSSENVLWMTCGYESYVTAKDHQEHAYQAAGPSDYSRLQRNERKSEAVQRANIQKVVPT